MASTATLAVKITGDVSDLQGKLRSVADSLESTAEKFNSIGSKMSGAITLPILGVGGAALKAAADNEQLNIAFTTMLGSADKAKGLMEDLARFAAETPFESAEIQRGAKMLLAYGVASGDITDNMRRLGDIASGVGVRLEDLAYLYGTTRVQGRLYTADLNQFTSRGIPMIEALAEVLGVATGEVKKMVEEGAVGFPEVEQAIKNLTDEGGKFNGLMEAQSTTLAGLFSTLKDNVALSLVDIGNAIIQAFDLKNASMKAIEGVEVIRNAIQDLAQNNPELLRTGVLVAAVAAAIGPAMIGIGLALNTIKNAVTGLSALAGVIGGLSAPVLLLIGAVAALGAAWYFNWFNMREIVALAVDNIKAKWEELAPIIIAKAQEIGAQLQEAWGGIQATLTEFGDTVLEPISNVVVMMLDAGIASGEVQEAIGALPEALQPAAQAFVDLSTKVGEMATTVTERWQAVTDAFAGGDTSIGGILGELQATILGIGTDVYDTTDNIREFVIALTGSTEAANAADEGLRAAGEGVATLQQGVTNAWLALLAFGAQVQGAANAVIEFLQPTIDRVAEAFAGLPTSLAPVIPAVQELGGAMLEFANTVRPALEALGIVIAAVLGVASIIAVNVFASAINSIGPIVTQVIEQVTANIKLVTTVLQEVAALITALAEGDWAGAWKALEGIVEAFHTYMDETLNNLLTIATTVGDGILEAIKGTLDTLNVDGNKVMETIKSWWESAWDTMAKAFKPVEDGINNIKSLIDGLQQAIDGFRSWLGGIKIEAPWANWKAPSLPGGFAIPGFQLGTTYARGGMAMINEGGRGEIVMLPTGAAVIPHQLSKDMLEGMGGGGVTVIIQNANMGSERDSWRLANQIDEMRRRRRN